MKVAVLDDYQGVASQMADWSQLPASAQVEYFRDHLADEDALAERLKDFDVVMGMRERTAFPRSLLARLPQLRLLVTTGRRNASFDIAAATEMGIVVPHLQLNAGAIKVPYLVRGPEPDTYHF